MVNIDRDTAKNCMGVARIAAMVNDFGSFLSTQRATRTRTIDWP
jgi:hypothetical protein